MPRLHSRLRCPSCMAAAALLTALAGCATPQERVEERRTQIATPPITHIVLIELKDPTRARELVDDCNRSVPGIPSVLAYACGQPLPSDRPNVMSDYTVGFFVSFKDEEGYKAYTDDPAHLALVEKWRTAWKGVRIFDFLDAPGAGFAPLPAPAAQPATQPEPAPASAPSTGPSPAPATTPAASPAPQKAPTTTLAPNGH